MPSRSISIGETSAPGMPAKAILHICSLAAASGLPAAAALCGAMFVGIIRSLSGLSASYTDCAADTCPRCGGLKLPP